MTPRDQHILSPAETAGVTLSMLDGSPFMVTDARRAPARGDDASVVVGLGDGGDVDASAFDILLTEAPAAPRPWITVAPGELDRTIDLLRARISAMPVAAYAFALVLRIGERLSFANALVVESLTYSTLLGGAEFAAWRAANPPRTRAASDATVIFERDGEHVTLTLARAARRNAMNAALRDELVECLRNVRDDPTVASLSLRGAGLSFCAGGDLDEFGTARDLALAHVVRITQSPAHATQQCRAPTTAYVQGACIGAGIEIASACNRIVARTDAFFQLPEISMGLIPGAGGTVTIPRRIGRHRACYFGLSGVRLDPRTAMAWGLVDGIESLS